MAHIHHPPSPAERLYRGQRHAHTHAYGHTRSQSAFDGRETDAPWRGMTNTFTWVEQEHFMKGHRRGQSMKTEDWVRQQRSVGKSNEAEIETVYHTPRARSTSSSGKIQRQEWEELIYVYEIEADEWMRQEERARRVAHEREKAKMRIQDELRRIEARYHQKREAERIARQAFLLDNDRRDRARRDKLIVDAWAKYEASWSALSSSSSADHLDFKTMPWPLVVQPQSPEDITPDGIVAFLFSSLHSHDQPRKDRIRSAQLRWHPDRFRRFIARVSEDDKAIVEEGVGIVARVLNELMEKEKKKGH